MDLCGDRDNSRRSPRNRHPIRMPESPRTGHCSTGDIRQQTSNSAGPGRRANGISHQCRCRIVKLELRPASTSPGRVSCQACDKCRARLFLGRGISQTSGTSPIDSMQHDRRTLREPHIRQLPESLRHPEHLHGPVRQSATRDLRSLLSRRWLRLSPCHRQRCRAMCQSCHTG